MPIHELGYRVWKGSTRPRWARAWSITRTGIALARRPVFVRRLCFLAIVPLLYLGWFFFAVGVITDPDGRIPSGFSQAILRGALGSEFMRALRDDPGAVRELIWNDMFLGAHTFVLPAVGLITLAVAPKLISNDLRTKAFLLYFSKPIGRLDYLLGKAGILAGYVAWFTLVPSIGAYVLSVLFAPSIDTLLQTWHIVPSIVQASLTTIVPVTALGLFISSTTRDQRVATFTMIAILVGGEITYWILHVELFPGAAWPMLLSLRETLSNAIANSFEAPTLVESFTESTSSSFSSIALAVLTVACSIGVWRRISAPMNS
ncbi:MAG: hypothetical protein KDB80_08955 [Planctomycetes bacterium]|nr:hypothetical protein [Planctomycetota bacterium]